MTRINKMVLHGFKSFAKRTELVFEPRFNCVLGPNGSGKSNILDALCFVLGRLGSKSLRAEKSANLVYNGGKTKKPMKQGEVSLFFDNTDKTFPTEDKEVKVTRIVKQSGQSVYKINDQRATRQQIIDLLSVARIDPGGYNIILQGDIVKFTEMHPEDRRGLIEEISGISVYEDKRQKAMKELEKVDERVKEAEVVLAERNKYLKELSKDREHAMRFKELKGKININKASYLHIQIEKREKRNSKLNKIIDEKQGKLDEFQKKINGIKSLVGQGRQEIDRINKEVEEKGEKEQVSVQGDIEALKVRLATNKTRADNLRDQLEGISARRIQLKKDLREHKSQLEQMNIDLEEFKKKKNAFVEEQKRVDAQIEGIRQKSELGDMTDIDTGMEEIDKILEKKQIEIDELRNEQQDLLRRKDNLEFQITTIDEKIEKVSKIERAHKEQVEALKGKKELFKSSIISLNKRLNEDSSLALQIAEKKRKLHNTHEELAKLKARKISIREEVGSFAIKKVLGQGIKGVYGTIRQLGTVRSEHALALEIAAGGRINSVVVENDEVAAKCISYLKKNKLGIATFLPLNKMRDMGGKVGSLVKQKGVLGLAIDLISFDNKYKKAFSYIFGNTLVVDDINTAKNIGIGKARMVTVDGDLAEVSGAMQGGFRQKKGRAGFHEKEILKDLKELESAAEELEGVVEVLMKRREENEELISRLREKKYTLEGEIIKEEKSLHLEGTDLNVNKKQKEGLGNEVSDVEKDISAIEEKINLINREIIENKTKKSQLRDKISELRDPAVIAEINAFEEKKAQLDKKIMNMDVEIRSISTKVNDIISPEKENIRKILKQQRKERETFEQEMEELLKQIERGKRDLKEKEEKALEFYKKHKGLLAKRTKIEDEIQEEDSKIDELREGAKEIEIKMNNLTIKKAEVNSKLAGLLEEFAQYEGVKIAKERDEEILKKRITKFERIVEEIGNVNMRALEVYDEIEKEYNILMDKKDRLGIEKEDVLKMMNEIEGKKKELFMRTFDTINENFKDIFNSLSNKGEASLVLENPEDPFEAGLHIKVRITGKKTMDIRSLSGGEKTLTALAFIFAIQECDPHSFYIMDEVDAALDKRNSEKLSKLLAKYADKAQYIIISHNDAIISEADTLYGISMNEHGISNVTSLKI